MQNTKIEYMYCDGSNYKFYGDFTVQGSLTEDDIKQYLHDHEFFIPHEVGLDHLLNLPMNQDDHYLHTFESFEATKETLSMCNSDEFIKRMKTADEKGWFSSFMNTWKSKGN